MVPPTSAPSWVTRHTSASALMPTLRPPLSLPSVVCSFRGHTSSSEDDEIHLLTADIGCSAPSSRRRFKTTFFGQSRHRLRLQCRCSRRICRWTSNCNANSRISHTHSFSENELVIREPGPSALVWGPGPMRTCPEKLQPCRRNENRCDFPSSARAKRLRRSWGGPGKHATCLAGRSSSRWLVCCTLPTTWVFPQEGFVGRSRFGGDYASTHKPGRGKPVSCALPVIVSAILPAEFSNGCQRHPRPMPRCSSAS